MNVSYDFRLRAAENGHRYTGYEANQIPDDPDTMIVTVVACACGWQAEKPDPTGPLSDPYITWADHVINRVTERVNTPMGRISMKDLP